MDATTNNGKAGSGPRFYRDYPNALPTIKYQAAIGNDFVRFFLHWRGDTLYLRPTGVLADRLGGSKALVKRFRNITIKHDYVSNPRLTPSPDDRVHLGPMIPLADVAAMPEVQSHPHARHAFERAVVVARRRHPRGAPLVRESPPPPEAAAVVVDPLPLPPSTPEPAPPEPDDLLTRVRARLALRAEFGKARQAEMDSLRDEIAALRRDVETASAELVTATASYRRLCEAVGNAYLMETDAERLAALEVIVEDISK